MEKFAPSVTEMAAKHVLPPLEVALNANRGIYPQLERETWSLASSIVLLKTALRAQLVARLAKRATMALDLIPLHARLALMPLDAKYV